MASYKHPEVLVSTEWLANHLDDSSIRVVEVGAFEPTTYDNGHITGAMHWPWKESLWDKAKRGLAFCGDTHG